MTSVNTPEVSVCDGDFDEPTILDRTRVVGKCIVQTNNDSNGIVCTGTDGGNSFYSHRDGDPGIKFTRTPFLPAKITNTL